jgi:hypothetical protein
MDLDWYSEDDLKNATLFNDESIIVSKHKKKEVIEEPPQLKKEIVDFENCFNINIECNNSKNLLNVLQYLSGVSNHLRNLIRGKCVKSFDIAQITFKNEEVVLILNYLKWLRDTCDYVKIFFAPPLRKDNSYDPNSVKPFKTSSYKFCNYSNSCLVHKNKNKTCDKNHFVFDMIINDISKLIDSLGIIGEENLNWVFKNKFLLIDYDTENKKYSIKQIDSAIEIDKSDNIFQIDKNLICKSFDVVSFVLNRMYDEAYTFLNVDNKSILINM